jgi:subfamily B ATP-binding cassette protein MsbA
MIPISNNLLIGNPKASKEDVINACKAAYAHKFIEELPEGYETNIGDLGNKLSGGQKQRITIARALLKDPQLLILDEATSSLDTESEQQVQYALDKLMLNRTSLVIAHRLSTIQKADRIILIDDGQILANGTHQQLLNTSKHYKKWVQIQRMD